jgi:hypothetical protein
MPKCRLDLHPSHLVIRVWTNHHTALRPVRERLLKLNYYVLLVDPLVKTIIHRV